jgi:hypothetical protein
MADQNAEFEARLRAEREAEFAERLAAERAAAADKPNRWQQLQEATGVDLADPLAATVAGGIAGAALGKPLERGFQAAMPASAAGPGGEPPGWKWARKTGYGEGQGLTVREQDEAFKAARKPVGSGKVSSKLTIDKPINLNEYMQREAKLAAEAQMKAQAARDAMTVGEKIAEKSPAWLRTVGRGAAGAMEALPPWMVRTAAGAGAGMQAVDAYNRLRAGDIGGGLIGGLGALGSAAALIPHPLVRGVGTAIGMGAPMLNEYLDTRAEGGHIDGYASGRKVIGALSQMIPALKASEALGRFEGRPLLITQTDRSKVGGGMLGGPGFSSLQLARPEYKGAEAAWGVNSPQTANTILSGYNRAKQQYGAEPVMTTMIGTPTQHQSNQMVFDALMREFMSGAEQGKLTPALQAKFNERLRAATNRQTGAPLFAEDVDVMAPNFRELANTFDRRAAASSLFGGTGIGGKKGQIFDYDKIIRETTDPMLLDAPSGALGNRMFTLSGGSVHNPELHPAFPHILQGQDLGLTFAPVPRELVMKDFAADVMRRKGREPGYMDYTRGYPPTQLITEDLLRGLEGAGFNEGGLAMADGGGLYANIHAKRKRIEAGSGEKMRKPGAPGAPTAEAFKESAKTAKMKEGGPSLSIGRGEKLPADQGAGLTAKGRAKYNRETGSNLKAPQPEGGPRKKSFCARMRPIAEKSERGSRARASMRRWNCSGFAEGGLA